MIEDVEKSLNKQKIENELFKYGGKTRIEQLKVLMQNIVRTNRIPDDWKTGITLLMFKNKKKPQ